MYTFEEKKWTMAIVGDFQSRQATLTSLSHDLGASFWLFCVHDVHEFDWRAIIDQLYILESFLSKSWNSFWEVP